MKVCPGGGRRYVPRRLTEGGGMCRRRWEVSGGMCWRRWEVEACAGGGGMYEGMS